jgi:hypothetical protein
MTDQFVVQLENRPGALAQLARAIASRGVNIVRLGAGGAGDHGYAVLTTDDPEAAREVLKGAGYDFVEGRTLLLELPDRPGELATVAERLGEAGVQILGVLVVGHQGALAEVAISVDDLPRARAALGLD